VVQPAAELLQGVLHLLGGYSDSHPETIRIFKEFARYNGRLKLFSQ
jgi:hypothetical protein